MAKSYFRQVPDFEYVNRDPNSQISDYITVKNFFKRGKLREDIFQNISFFEKYSIKGNDRPDNVAYEVYKDSTLDWVILLSNNIMDVYNEWPLTQQAFDTYLFKKYDDYDTLYNGIHHYETREIKSSDGIIVLPEGLQVDSGYTVSYFDSNLQQLIDAGNVTIPITNYEYEERLENKKRNIYVLRPEYLNVVIDDMESIMEYQKGSTQYVSRTLKRGENIKLYQ